MLEGSTHTYCWCSRWRVASYMFYLVVPLTQATVQAGGSMLYSRHENRSRGSREWQGQNQPLLTPVASVYTIRKHGHPPQMQQLYVYWLLCTDHAFALQIHKACLLLPRYVTAKIHTYSCWRHTREPTKQGTFLSSCFATPISAALSQPLLSAALA